MFPALTVQSPIGVPHPSVFLTVGYVSYAMRQREDHAGGHPCRRPTAGRPTNLALLVLVPLAVLTGLFANTIGTDWVLDPAAVHGVVAVAIALLSPWKSMVIRRGLRRRTPDRWVSVGLLLLVFSTLATGAVHAGGYQGRIGPLTVMQVHVGGALIALALVVVHYRSHPVQPRPQDLTRRSLLRTAGLAGLASMALAEWETALNVAGVSGGERRFTGSHERGSFDPRRLPVTSWLDDHVQHIGADEWILRVGERSLTLDEVAAMPHENLTAVLDCTSAWYSEQAWSGIRLDRLVDPATCASIEVRSATGYTRRLPSRDLDRTWLVTGVGGEPLSAGHGYPARIVAPGRRGFWWVKWATTITPSDLPWWIQSPFPLT